MTEENALNPHKANEFRSKLCSNWQIFFRDMIDLLESSQPFFLSRIGGSDTSAVIDYRKSLGEGDEAFASHLKKFIPIVEAFNGFYHLGNGKARSYEHYIKLLDDSYMSSTIATLGHSHVLSIYFSEFINERFFVKEIPNREAIECYLNNILTQHSFAKAYPYNFIETVVKNPFTLFQAMSRSLTGKKVLVISPFSESIRSNFHNRHHFFKLGFDYPDFELLTLNTPITYSGMSSTLYPHQDWNETVDYLTEKIYEFNFDVALLSCGSYAMPLGKAISCDIGKKAIYVGGILQLLFGIMGRRYESEFFTDQINRSHFIRPLEAAKYLEQIEIQPETAKEALGAYF